MESGVKALEQAQVVTKGTHQIAMGIMEAMQDQRFQIQNANGKIEAVKGNAQISNKYINTMERRELVYKVLLFVVIVVLFVTIFSLLYIKITRFRS